MAKLRIAERNYFETKQLPLPECYDDLPLSFKSAPGGNVERISK